MPLQQQKFREIVFQILFSHDIGKPEDEEIMKLIMKEFHVSRKHVRDALNRCKGVLEKIEEIDSIIQKLTKEYAFQRIQAVEKNILRLEIYELLFDESIPSKVAISEGIRLCRKFSTKEAASFVNAVLDNVYHMDQGEKVDHRVVQKTFEMMDQEDKIKNEQDSI